MKSYDDMYFVSLLFAYGAKLHAVKKCDHKKEFVFSSPELEKIFVLQNEIPVTVNRLPLDDVYSHYQRRELLFPPNFPEGRRRFLELLHAKEF